MRTWYDPSTKIVHIVHIVGKKPFTKLWWPVCYSKHHPEGEGSLGNEMPTCLWCIATTTNWKDDDDEPMGR